MQPIRQLPFVADDPALDFVNTAEERGHPEAGDVLLTPADLRLWGQRYGLLARSAPLGPEADAELARAREARELLYDLFLARTQGRAPARRRLARLAELSAEAYAAASLQPGADGSVSWRWSSADLTTVRHVAVAGAVDLLHAEPSPRLKQCPGDHCGWFFLDATKRGNRRWCRMSECGQEAKDERRRLRRQGTGRSELA
ncbi:MAG TPA: ABATE domain-containing protein [Solirubrobacteraceae bacterium]|nr:ABATE domain-containing protein [Solirubrobacteraceae bacterium]